MTTSNVQQWLTQKPMVWLTIPFLGRAYHGHFLSWTRWYLLVYEIIMIKFREIWQHWITSWRDFTKRVPVPVSRTDNPSNSAWVVYYWGAAIIPAGNDAVFWHPHPIWFFSNSSRFHLIRWSTSAPQFVVKRNQKACRTKHWCNQISTFSSRCWNHGRWIKNALYRKKSTVQYNRFRIQGYKSELWQTSKCLHKHTLNFK